MEILWNCYCGNITCTLLLMAIRKIHVVATRRTVLDDIVVVIASIPMTAGPYMYAAILLDVCFLFGSDGQSVHQVTSFRLCQIRTEDFWHTFFFCCRRRKSDYDGWQYLWDTNVDSQHYIVLIVLRVFWFLFVTLNYHRRIVHFI